MNIQKIIRIFVIQIGFILTACGGGGGGSNSEDIIINPTQPPAPGTFPVAQAFSQLLINGFYVSISATEVSLNPIPPSTTSGYYQLQPAKSRVFEGQVAMATDKVISRGNSSGTGNIVIATADYYDSNYNYIGSKSFDYIVATQIIPLPTRARVGDTGMLSAAVGYETQDKTIISSTITRSYKIEADTDTSAIFVLIEQINVDSMSGTKIETRYRITQSGVASLISQYTGYRTGYLSLVVQ